MYLCLGVTDFAEETFQFAQQLGVGHIKICGGHLMGPTQCGVLPRDALADLQDRMAQYDCKLSVVLLPQGKDTQYWNARLGLPARDQEIEDMCETIRVCAEAKVPVVEWTWSIVDVWGHLPRPNDFGRGGASIARFDYDRVKDVGPERPEYAVEAEEMWDRLTYVLERIVPVAEECGVRLAMHHQDPPTPYLRGEARILSTVAGMKRFVETVDSPANGLNLCQGTLAEQADSDVLQTIRTFGERDKINHVHFRNVRGRVPRFDEVFIDEGDTDMLEAMKVYKSFGYRYAMMPDHTPGIVGDSRWGHIGRAYALGYMRALMKAVGW